jgi:hypothetical protein
MAEEEARPKKPFTQVKYIEEPKKFDPNIDEKDLDMVGN